MVFVDRFYSVQDFLGSKPSPVFFSDQPSAQSSLSSVQNNNTSEDMSEDDAMVIVENSQNRPSTDENYPEEEGFRIKLISDIFDSYNSTTNQSSAPTLRLKIKMPNAHNFVRSYAVDTLFIEVLKDIKSQVRKRHSYTSYVSLFSKISLADHDKCVDIIYDHPQKSLSQELRLRVEKNRHRSLQEIYREIFFSPLSSFGITVDTILYVRFT
jgi:hypothetical protein